MSANQTTFTAIVPGQIVKTTTVGETVAARDALADILAAHGLTPDDLVEAADAMAYLAKRFGRIPVPALTTRRRTYVDYRQGPPCEELAQISDGLRSLAGAFGDTTGGASDE